MNIERITTIINDIDNNLFLSVFPYSTGLLSGDIKKAIQYGILSSKKIDMYVKEIYSWQIDIDEDSNLYHSTSHIAALLGRLQASIDEAMNGQVVLERTTELQSNIYGIMELLESYM